MTTPRDAEKSKILADAETLVGQLEKHLQEIEQMTAERRAADDHPSK